MKIIKQRQRKTATHYEINFYLKENNEICAGYPCDKDGNIAKDINPCAAKNYENDLLNDKLYHEIREWSNTYTDNAIGICDKCGDKVQLYDQYMGACQCHKCGEWYNLFGQNLLPPENWEE